MADESSKHCKRPGTKNKIVYESEITNKDDSLPSHVQQVKTLWQELKSEYPSWHLSINPLTKVLSLSYIEFSTAERVSKIAQLLEDGSWQAKLDSDVIVKYESETFSSEKITAEVVKTLIKTTQNMSGCKGLHGPNVKKSLGSYNGDVYSRAGKLIGCAESGCLRSSSCSSVIVGKETVCGACKPLVDNRAGIELLLQDKKYLNEVGKLQLDVCNLETKIAMSKEKVRDFKSRLVMTYLCKPCNIVYTDMRKYRWHTNKYHSFHRWLTCDLCGREYHKRALLENHKKLFHVMTDKNKNFHCEKCKMYFPTKVSLERHNKSHFRMKEVNRCYDEVFGETTFLFQRSAKGPRVRCDICSQQFTSACSLKHHKLETHSQVPGFRCEKCESAYQKFSNYYIHWSFKHSSTRYPCNICGKQFKCQPKLQDHHKIVHLKIKNFGCSKCNRRFHFQHELLRHLRRCYFDKKQASPMKTAVREHTGGKYRPSGTQTKMNA